MSINSEILFKKSSFDSCWTFLIDRHLLSDIFNCFDIFLHLVLILFRIYDFILFFNFYIHFRIRKNSKLTLNK